MVELLTESDADLADFLSETDGPPSGRALFFLRSACEEVRDYCGWHIAPVVTETIDKLSIGSEGIILLPSLHVTDVASVVIDGVTIDPAGYEWFKQGFIETRSPVYRHGFTGFSGGGSPVATVTLTHGYAACPLAVKAAIFDMMETAYETPTGDVQSVTAPGYGVTFGMQQGGSGLSSGVMSKLSPYRIGGIK